MKVIEKKYYSDHFRKAISGEKRFELRKDDDSVQAGDTLFLREWDPDLEAYTGRSARFIVRYVLRDVPGFGLMPGYCIIGL